MTFTLLESLGPEEPSADAQSFMVAMRDGVRLATDVYLPAEPSQHAAVLVRTPYDKTSRYTGLRFEAHHYTDRGYVFIAQDVRGKFRSEGQTLPYAYDVDDAYDTVDWIIQQRWSSGRVGLKGASYYGYTVWAGVASGHPAIRAAVPQVTAIDMGASHVASDWRHEVPSLIGFNDLVQIWTDNAGYLADIDYSRPINEAAAEAEKALGACLAVHDLFDRAERSEGYSPYPEGRHPYEASRIPIFHWVGWFDPGLGPHGMADYRHFTSAPEQRDLHYLHVGSADHGGYLLSDVGRGDEANPYLNDEVMNRLQTEEAEEVLRFLDEHLQGKAHDRPMPRVRWHLGHESWHEAETWPPPGTSNVELYLSAGSSGGTLTQTVEPTPTRLGWRHDPESPVPSSTPIEAIWYFLAAYPDERARAGRPDVLTFTTEPLRDALDVVGLPVARLVLSTTAPSMHLFATLQDVYPDGTTRPVAHGRMVVAHPMADVPVDVPLADMAYRFLPGHRVQLQVASSDFPWFLVHPGTDDNPWSPNRRTAAVDISLNVGGVVPSVLSLPVLR